MSKQRARVIGMGKDIFKDDDPKDNHPIDGFFSNETRVIDVNLDRIFTNPEQPRKFFDEEGLNDLSRSVKQHGILQPVIVKKNENGFLLVAGERRFRAAKIAGLKKIPALIKSDNSLEIAIIENIQREDLKPLEEAEGLQMLIDRFSYTHEDLAKIIGKSRSSITELLSLNKLPDQIKSECRTSDICSKSHLLHLVRAQDEDKMINLWDKVKNGKFSVKDIKKNNPKNNRPKPYKYRFIPPEKNFSLTINFKKSEVDKEEIKFAFEKALDDFLKKYPTDNIS